MLEDADDYLSVWMGTSHLSLDEFNAYTDGLESGGRDGKPCQACVDFGVSFIDTDWFVAYGTAGNAIVPIEELAQEVDARSHETLAAVIQAARDKGITEGNSLYYHVRAKFTPADPDQRYNGLSFIGSFHDPRKSPKRR